ncbi:MAG TPA: hypothetical protein VKV79_05975 [Terriglobia bacterium]|nr:hypothetical protein [Terriglobia bacterium]
MKQAGALIGVVIALGIGYYIYRAQLTPGPAGVSAPQQAIDTTGITADLLSIGQAERLYLASHGSYATLDQLQAEGDITFSGANRRGYNFTADLDDGQHFTITATPSDPSKTGWPTFSIDETMQVKQQ